LLNFIKIGRSVAEIWRFFCGLKLKRTAPDQWRVRNFCKLGCGAVHSPREVVI